MLFFFHNSFVALAYNFKMLDIPYISNHFLIIKMLYETKCHIIFIVVWRLITIDILDKLLVSLSYVFCLLKVTSDFFLFCFKIEHFMHMLSLKQRQLESLTSATFSHVSVKTITNCDIEWLTANTLAVIYCSICRLSPHVKGPSLFNAQHTLACLYMLYVQHVFALFLIDCDPFSLIQLHKETHTL